jgi:hypothetical protein
MMSSQTVCIVWLPLNSCNLDALPHIEFRFELLLFLVNTSSEKVPEANGTHCSWRLSKIVMTTTQHSEL